MHFWHGKTGSILSAMLLAVPLAVSCVLPGSAFADEQGSDHAELVAVRNQIKADLQAVEDLEDQIESTCDRVEEIDVEIQDTLEKIGEMQVKHSRLQSNATEAAVQLYKERLAYNPLYIVQNAESITDAIRLLDMRDRIFVQYGVDLVDTKVYGEKLQKQYQKVSEEKDEQIALVKELQDKSRELTKSISDLKAREKELNASEKAALAQAAAAAGKVAKTFDTGSMSGSDAEWHSGLASAYGGESDDMTPKDALTATGTVCDDWSVGVAVPLAWGPSQYYGRNVEISYNGQSIIAPVVDCGGMNGGERALDLQPGVFKAFGCETCDEWGVREVLYRFL